jgi:hypothetical protein
MTYNESREPIEEEENEIVSRGFGNRKNPLDLKSSSLQERTNELHTVGSMKILGNTVGSPGKVTILGNQLKREQNGILKKL